MILVSGALQLSIEGVLQERKTYNAVRHLVLVRVLKEVLELLELLKTERSDKKCTVKTLKEKALFVLLDQLCKLHRNLHKRLRFHWYKCELSNKLRRDSDGNYSVNGYIKFASSKAAPNYKYVCWLNNLPAGTRLWYRRRVIVVQQSDVFSNIYCGNIGKGQHGHYYVSKGVIKYYREDCLTHYLRIQHERRQQILQRQRFVLVLRELMLQFRYL